MKALLSGMGSYQGAPTNQSYIVINYLDRLEDGEGEASVAQYFGVFDPGTLTWRDAHFPDLPLLVPVTLGRTTRIEITEVFRYADRPEMRTTFGGWAAATALDGTELDYTQLRGLPLTPGAEPLTMQAARQLLGVVPELREVMAAVEGTLTQFAAQNAAVDAQLANLLTLSDLNVFYAGVAASAAQHQLLYGWSVQPVQQGGGLQITSNNETAALSIYEDSEGSITYTVDPSRLDMSIDADGNITVEAI